MASTACFTGHRPQKLPFGFNEEHPGCIALKRLLREEIQRLIGQHGVTEFLSGMALGSDIWVAETVLDLKREAPRLTLRGVLPFPQQTEKWNTKPMKIYLPRYETILRQADSVHTTSDRYFKEKGSDSYSVRNQYMVDHSQHILAVWDGKPSGSGKTLAYAREKGLHRVIINPRDLSVREENQ